MHGRPKTAQDNRTENVGGKRGKGKKGKQEAKEDEDYSNKLTNQMQQFHKFIS
jgi:hypothetical protein